MTELVFNGHQFWLRVMSGSWLLCCYLAAFCVLLDLALVKQGGHKTLLWAGAIYCVVHSVQVIFSIQALVAGQTEPAVLLGVISAIVTFGAVGLLISGRGDLRRTLRESEWLDLLRREKIADLRQASMDLKYLAEQRATSGGMGPTEDGKQT